MGCGSSQPGNPSRVSNKSGQKNGKAEPWDSNSAGQSASSNRLLSREITRPFLGVLTEISDVNKFKLSTADMVGEKHGDLSKDYIKILPAIGEGLLLSLLKVKSLVGNLRALQGGMVRFSKSCTRLLR